MQDLLEARACIEWVREHLLDFDDRTTKWLEEKTSIQVRSVPDPATHDAVVVHEHELLPPSFSVELGAYLNTLRSSLDVLAMVLVQRNCIEMADEEVYFPIVADEQALQRSRLVRKLPISDRDKLLALKPYRNGNPTLWVLHRLDILRKHRRLLDVRLVPHPAFFSEGFEPIHGTAIRGGPGDTIFGLLRKDAPPLYLQMMGVSLVIDEVEAFAPFEVVALLHGLAYEANRAIDLFDE